MASVLIIDDDWATVETYGRKLRLEGYQVYTATTGDAGLVEAEQHPTDAVLLDLADAPRGWSRVSPAAQNAHDVAIDAGHDRHGRLSD